MTIDRNYNPSIPLSYANPKTPAAISFLQAHQGDQRISGTLQPTGDALLADLAERYGLRDIQSYELPKPLRWHRLWNALGQPPGDLSDWDPNAAMAHLTLDLFAAKYVLLPPGVSAPSWSRPAFRYGGELVVENPTALPRAWVAYSWRPVTTSGQA
jgi:hypothetical protein